MPKDPQQTAIPLADHVRDISPKALTLRTLPLKDIAPSPFQQRKIFDPDKLKKLAQSIMQDGLISPILVRPIGDGFGLIAGERRFRVIRDYTNSRTIEALVIEVDDNGARRLCAAENLQREDLTVFETIEAIVELVDAELENDDGYASMGQDSVDRVSTLFGKLHSVSNSKERGSQVSQEGQSLLDKFIQQLERAFMTLPKSLEWRSFYKNDLNLLTETPQEVRDLAIQQKLNKSQIRALGKLNAVSEDRFKSFVLDASPAKENKALPVKRSSEKRSLEDYSAVEIQAVAEKEAEKQSQEKQKQSRQAIPYAVKAKAFLMHRLGIPNEIIASNLNIDSKTASRYGRNAELPDTIREALDDGLSPVAIAKKYAVPEPLVWSVALEDKDDRDRFDALGWKLRTWDYWFWSNCDQRFGDDWPGRIPAQMIAHILYYFSEPGDLMLDPMAGGGVVADTCLAMNRKCRSFDMEKRFDTRPEIETHFWDANELRWPIKGKDKPALIIFDPPYFSKKTKDYDPDAVSGMSKDTYLDFMKQFLSLTNRRTDPTCRIAFVNADWRDFQGTPAKEETRENSVLISDYLRTLYQSGWEETHIIQAPLSSERFTGNMVKAMQRRKTLGVISRYIIVARKSG